MFRRILLSLVAIGILASLIGLGGLSLFTASTDNDNNAFTTGSVDITTNPATAFLSMNDMAPGDTADAGIDASFLGSSRLQVARMKSVLCVQMQFAIRRIPYRSPGLLSGAKLIFST